jgi:hypothetical protein
MIKKFKTTVKIFTWVENAFQVTYFFFKRIEDALGFSEHHRKEHEHELHHVKVYNHCDEIVYSHDHDPHHRDDDKDDCYA